MTTDVIELREFYASPLGKVVVGVLRARLRRAWPVAASDENVLAVGYVIPLLRPYLSEVKRLVSVMAGVQGGVYWPSDGANLVGLADLRLLPFADDSVDRVVMMHALEGAEDANAVLKEVWRVLKGEGKALIIVPNRRGCWAHSDKTPFGTGQPYSSDQLKNALKDHGFIIDRTWKWLHFPPVQSKFLLAVAAAWEKYVGWMFQGMGGILVMEARKQLYAPVFTKSRAPSRGLALHLSFPANPLPAGRDSYR
ncbi:MAG: methyltransferase domain-containing protein [Alphaproteobacteria bacterium]|nr:methyltransferase domain-containing protein [Alphaproteobacteria bacterium]